MDNRARTPWGLVALIAGLAAGMAADSWAQTRPDELPRATPSEVGLSPKKLQNVHAGIQALVDQKWTPGMVLLVARHGKVALLEGFGKMDVAAGKPMRPDAIFRIRSMTKPITVVGALLLVEEGKIKLDDPVSTYLPELKGLRVYAGEGRTVEAKREMTIRDLMCHTSGLGYGYEGTPVDKLYDENKIINGTAADMVRKLGKLPLQDQPGTRFRYSFSTDVLGRVIEVVSCKPLDEFFGERVFRPLDMRDTGFVVPENKLDRLTTSYHSEGQGKWKVTDAPAKSRHCIRHAFLSGGAGLVSTARDYFRFCQTLLNGGELEGKRLLRGETVREMTRNQLPAEALPIAFGGFPVPGQGIGLGVMVRLDTKSAAKDLAAGEWSWGGAESTFFWVAPKPELIIIALQQVEPLNIVLPIVLNSSIHKAIVE